MYNLRSAIIIVIVILSTPITIFATAIDDIMYSLKDSAYFHANVDYRVTLPFANDVHYKVTLNSKMVDNDTLSPCAYNIEYSLGGDGDNHFMSYFGGNYYRFENKKLNEYHWTWDSIPFQSSNGGVQRSGMFVSLLPNFMAQSLVSLINNDENIVAFYPDTTYNDDKANIIKIEERQQGYVMRKLLFAFDINSNKPTFIEIENNPGTISEQTVKATYNYGYHFTKIDFNERQLQHDYPEVFDKYRVSNFKIENMPGRHLPDFSLPTTTGERYTFDGGFRAPTIVVFLDCAGGMTTETITEVRDAIEALPIVANVIWTFMGNNLDDIWVVMPSTKIDEYALIGARKFASECGVTGCPTLLFVSNDGIVRDTIIGYNNDIKNLVIQKIGLIIQSKN
ncbi:MAG: hypothetical protein RSC87_06875 [Muribaculaceae bacterium]